ncbi:hypothetical protein P5F78_01845, partial [Shouchella clausii]|uniref:hypothetical protein n=1 Tax=Shouchella clausii TaxID=79880 RepID=UPI002E239CC0|nr:hypothetical protein [Shouchella clausii]
PLHLHPFIFQLFGQHVSSHPVPFFSFLLYKKACRLSRENRDFVDRLKPPNGGFLVSLNYLSLIV